MQRTRAELSSLLELTRAGGEPFRLATGEARGFLEEGDEVVLRGRCAREGYVAIESGECRGRISP
jgi:fumarylacetoacetase